MDGLDQTHTESDPSSLASLFGKLMGASLPDLPDEAGTSEDELMILEDAAGQSPHSRKYLALRCKQEMLSATRGRGNK